MPKKPKRGPVKKGGSELSQDQLCFLVSGYCLNGAIGVDRFEVDGELLPFTSAEAMAAAYKKHQAAVEVEVTVERQWSHELRSWGWWKYEAPEPKRQLSGPKPLKENYIHRGEPALWENFEDCQAAIFETDGEYLTRLNLLQPGDIEGEK